MDETIKSVFKKINIDVNKIEKINNSYSSNVYLVYSSDKKFIFKILYNEKKRIDEYRYLKHLSKYINVPKPIYSNYIEDYSINVLEFVEGKSYMDFEINSLNNKEIFDAGVLLGELHSTPLLDKAKSKWYKYLLEYLNKSNENLKSNLKNNEQIYDYLLGKIKLLKDEYINVILHLDFRIGNIIFGNTTYLIDFESMKNGDPAFDFLKMKRILTDEQFILFLNGYKSVKPLLSDLDERLDFYNLFDAYTSLNWCYERKKLDSDFYKQNLKILMKKFNK